MQSVPFHSLIRPKKPEQDVAVVRKNASLDSDWKSVPSRSWTAEETTAFIHCLRDGWELKYERTPNNLRPRFWIGFAQQLQQTFHVDAHPAQCQRKYNGIHDQFQLDDEELYQQLAAAWSAEHGHWGVSREEADQTLEPIPSPPVKDVSAAAEENKNPTRKPPRPTQRPPKRSVREQSPRPLRDGRSASAPLLNTGASMPESRGLHQPLSHSTRNLRPAPEAQPTTEPISSDEPVPRGVRIGPPSPLSSNPVRASTQQDTPAAPDGDASAVVPVPEEDARHVELALKTLLENLKAKLNTDNGSRAAEDAGVDVLMLVEEDVGRLDEGEGGPDHRGGKRGLTYEAWLQGANQELRRQQRRRQREEAHLRQHEAALEAAKERANHVAFQAWLERNARQQRDNATHGPTAAPQQPPQPMRNPPPIVPAPPSAFVLPSRPNPQPPPPTRQQHLKPTNHTPPPPAAAVPRVVLEDLSQPPDPSQAAVLGLTPPPSPRSIRTTSPPSRLSHPSSPSAQPSRDSQAAPSASVDEPHRKDAVAPKAHEPRKDAHTKRTATKTHADGGQAGGEKRQGQQEAAKGKVRRGKHAGEGGENKKCRGERETTTAAASTHTKGSGGKNTDGRSRVTTASSNDSRSDTPSGAPALQATNLTAGSTTSPQPDAPTPSPSPQPPRKQHIDGSAKAQPPAARGGTQGTEPAAAVDTFGGEHSPAAPLLADAEAHTQRLAWVDSPLEALRVPGHMKGETKRETKGEVKRTKGDAKGDLEGGVPDAKAKVTTEALDAKASKSRPLKRSSSCEPRPSNGTGSYSDRVPMTRSASDGEVSEPEVVGLGSKTDRPSQLAHQQNRPGRKGPGHSRGSNPTHGKSPGGKGERKGQNPGPSGSFNEWLRKKDKERARDESELRRLMRRYYPQTVAAFRAITASDDPARLGETTQPSMVPPPHPLVPPLRLDTAPSLAGPLWRSSGLGVYDHGDRDRISRGRELQSQSHGGSHLHHPDPDAVEKERRTRAEAAARRRAQEDRVQRAAQQEREQLTAALNTCGSVSMGMFRTWRNHDVLQMRQVSVVQHIEPGPIFLDKTSLVSSPPAPSNPLLPSPNPQALSSSSSSSSSSSLSSTPAPPPQHHPFLSSTPPNGTISANPNAQHGRRVPIEHTDSTTSTSAAPAPGTGGSRPSLSRIGESSSEEGRSSAALQIEQAAARLRERGAALRALAAKASLAISAPVS